MGLQARIPGTEQKFHLSLAVVLGKNVPLIEKVHLARPQDFLYACAFRWFVSLRAFFIFFAVCVQLSNVVPLACVTNAFTKLGQWFFSVFYFRFFLIFLFLQDATTCERCRGEKEDNCNCGIVRFRFIRQVNDTFCNVDVSICVQMCMCACEMLLFRDSACILTTLHSLCCNARAQVSYMRGAKYMQSIEFTFHIYNTCWLPQLAARKKSCIIFQDHRIYMYMCVCVLYLYNTRWLWQLADRKKFM